ncbi:MAG: SDR family oxidoreductase [Pirellulales bacterium]
MSESPRVVLLTGASRGIGAAAARLFAASGYRVALVARSQIELEEVASGISKAGGEALPIVGDLSDLDFVQRAVETTCAKMGRIDVLVNNAAWRELASMRRISLESWEKTLRVCLTAPAFLARWAAENMMLRSSGAIINVSSMMSQQAAGISPAYIASKGGLDSLTYELASLYGPHGIRVVTVQPGAVNTELSSELDRPSDESDDIRAFSEDMIMLRRWANAEEIARVILFLASSDASYITGTTITVDGGWFHQHFPLSLKQQRFRDDYP